MSSRKELKLFRRYLRNMKRFRDRKKRRAAAVLFAAAVLWGTAAFFSRGELLRYREESRIEYHFPADSEQKVTWQVNFDFRSGKLSVVREEIKPEEGPGRGGDNLDGDEGFH